MSRLLPATLLAVWSLALASHADACECGAKLLPGRALEQADLVFFGRASFVGRAPGEDGGDDPDLSFVEFSVEGVWKGPAQSRLRVHPSSSAAGCAIAFKPGKSYLVYAYRDTTAYSNRFHTSVCSRTRVAEHALPDLAILGAPQHRFDTSEPDPTAE